MQFAPVAAAQGSVRLALYHTGLGRTGPGLFLQDIRRRTDDILAVRDAIVALSPDAILLLDIDHDPGGVALAAFTALLAEGGHPMPHVLAPRPNTGLATGLDLDGDGRRGTADDAQGWGRFAGSGGMALLSRLPIDAASLRDHTRFLWRDLPGARLPRVNGHLFPSVEVFDLQRLSSTGHWEVTLTTQSGPLTLMAWHAGPPAFGGPHDRNRNRNADETAFWLWRLESGPDPPPRAFVLMGDSNLDPEAAGGEPAVMAALLAHPRLQDPAPVGHHPLATVSDRATAYWPDGPGALRVDYLLPSTGLRVVDGGVTWPYAAARHAIVWADLAF